jgi:hypothetical protein
MPLRTATIRVAVLLSVALASVQAANTSRPLADSFAKKVAIINQHAEAGARVARRTTLTESELNSWFAFRSQPHLPAGVTQPTIRIVGNGRLLGGATVDLEAFGRSRASSSALWSLLGGRVPLSVTGILHTRDGQGRFELQSADVSGVPLPTSLLQELVSFYTRSAEVPSGLRLDDVFTLPASIKRIEVGQGQAVVVQ